MRQLNIVDLEGMDLDFIFDRKKHHLESRIDDLIWNLLCPECMANYPFMALNPQKGVYAVVYKREGGNVRVIRKKLPKNVSRIAKVISKYRLGRVRVNRERIGSITFVADLSDGDPILEKALFDEGYNIRRMSKMDVSRKATRY